MSNDLGLDHSDLEIDDALQGAAEGAILLAQVDVGRDPGAGSSSSEQPSGNAPGISVIAPDRDARIYLAAPASLEEIRLDGNDLLLIQPDGSQIRITGGALTVPTFIIGDIEVPQEVLIAALAANGFDVAAGPGGALSLSPQAPAGSGGELEPSSDATLVGDVRGVLGLLGDSAEAEDQSFEEGSDVPAAQDATITPNRTNNAPVVSGAVTGAAVEDGASVSLSALANASDVDAATVLTVVDLPATLPAGVNYDAATQRFTLDPSAAAYQSLAAGAVTTVPVTYGVSDGIATTPASVSWTVTGTNDAPVVSGAVTGTAIEDGSSVSLDALA
ncbi:MAG: VCBS domain-containing protein, partial [Hoeflea sp.]|nr:VCBS domain-containing protein [Hoeflea sp.]